MMQEELTESLAGRFFLHRCTHWGYPECRDAFGWSLEQWIYFGGYVPLEAAIRMYNGGIQFIDTVGNAFVNHQPLFIFVKGNKPGKEETAIPVGRLFKGVGLKIAYLLLCQPELAGRPYRKLAEMTDVALGTVNGTMTELILKGFVLDMGKKGKRLLNRMALFERWVAAYTDYLKPKLLLVVSGGTATGGKRFNSIPF